MKLLTVIEFVRWKLGKHRSAFSEAVHHGFPALIIIALILLVSFNH